MSKADRFEVDGVVVDKLPGAKFKVKIDNGHICTCTLAGKLRMNNIRILVGDEVTIDLSATDPFGEGRIIYRNK